MIREEFGSDFHYVLSEKWRNLDAVNSFFDKKDYSLHFSGRSALYSILKSGIEEFGWKTIAVPSYYCHEVYSFIEKLPIRIQYYEITPFFDRAVSLKNWEDTDQTAILIVDYFGLGKPNIENIEESVIIEDLTHNLGEIKNSNAHYCFGSLRKVLPLPVGGFSYSPKKLNLEVPLQNLKAEDIAVKKIVGMYLKKMYIEQNFHEKDTFRTLFAESEHDFEESFTYGALPKIVNELLRTLRVNEIVLKKRDNLRFAKQLLKPTEIFQVISNNNNSEFALILKFNDCEKRDSMKHFLIEERIYPIVLWPDQKSEANRNFQDSILFIHFDFRYNNNQIEHIISKINQYTNNA